MKKIKVENNDMLLEGDQLYTPEQIDAFIKAAQKALDYWKDAKKLL